MRSPRPGLVRFGREICGDLVQAERREWWLANGRGAYASGTIAGTLTRRYHGLLVAAVEPPLGRVLVLAKADATLIDGDRHHPLFANRWSDGSVDPHGFVDIESFHLDGRMPVWRFGLGDVLIEQRIWMEHGADTTYVAYRLVPGSTAARREFQLSIRLLANGRDHHGVSAVGDIDPDISVEGTLLRVEHRGRFALHIRAHGGTIAPQHVWHRGFDLPRERERGLEDRDNHLCVGVATIHLRDDEWSGLAASLDQRAPIALAPAQRRSLARDAALLARAKGSLRELREAPSWIDQLVLAADSFIFARPIEAVPDGESVIAGFPWFGDWGRDTMIALPGLTLATGRADTAARILKTFAQFVDRGMLPNVFLGAGETAQYNTADATLWYIEAWRAYVAATGDEPALRHAFPVLQNIIEWHLWGTRHGIRVDEHDGLLRAGEPGVQLTWMDAKVGDWVVTPRVGKPVEINALWFNALSIMGQLAERLGLSGEPYLALAARVAASFERYVNPENGGLYDILDGPDGTDPTVRPNQILALSLSYPALAEAHWHAVLALVGRELLTSYGLRSLGPRDPSYQPRHQGGVRERDGAYHQGTVWAWLLGHYALAEFRVHGDAAAAQQRLEALRDHLADAGLGTVSEIFDGAAPHEPRGCPSQAWSVACTLQAWCDLERRRLGERRTPPEPDHAP